MAAQAVQCFRLQTYPDRELIILDDEAEPSFDVDAFRADLNIRYVLSKSRSIPEKRNAACHFAADLIIHWDSDDWSEPTRIKDQVNRIEESGLSVTGYNTMLFYGEHLDESEKYWKYHGKPNYALGTSLCYTKAFWRQHPFPESKNIGEDNAMVEAAKDRRQILTVDAGQLMVARIHEGNTAKKYMHGTQYRKVTRDDFPEGFFR